MKQRRSLLAYILLGVFLLGGAAYLFAPFLGKEDAPSASNTTNAPAATYVKEGEVVFWKEGQKNIKIDVEIAENDAERAKGLMYRSSIPDSVGMLFIFEDSAPRGFWMRNTSIPLDIIYVDQNKKVVSVSKNTKPFSEENIPSFGSAQFVVEVNAGFAERHNIKPGDAISF